MMVISLLVEVQAVDLIDPRIQAASRSILELCSEMSQEPINLLWPLLTAGACCITEEDRDWVRRLFTSAKDDHCKDLEIAVSPNLCFEVSRKGTADKGIRMGCWSNSGQGWIADSNSHLGPL